MAIGFDIPFQNVLKNDKPRENESEKKKRKNSLYEDYKRIEGYYKKTKQIIGLFRNSPAFWVIIIIVGVIFFALFSDGGVGFGLGGSNDEKENPTTGEPLSPPIPGFSIALEGPEVSENGVDLIYTVTITHNPSVAPPLDQIELYDSLPSGAALIETTGALKTPGSTPNTWALSEPQNQSPFTVTIRPNVIDAFFNYTVGARQIFSSSSGGVSPATLEQLIAGQGRSVEILGSKESFVSTIIQNGQKLADFNARRTHLEIIYDTGAQHSVNPVVLLSIWGVEDGFSLNSILGCGIYSSGPPKTFTEGVECAGKTLDFWMGDFESKYNGSPVNIASNNGNTCTYTDSFSYAYEWYTPVCHANDNNSGAIELFSELYSMFMGI